MKRTGFDRHCARALRNAGAVAREMGHCFVGSEHLLLALSMEPECRDILCRYGADTDRLYRAAVQLRGMGDRGTPLVQGLSDGADRIIGAALQTSEVLSLRRLLWAVLGTINMQCITREQLSPNGQPFHHGRIRMILSLRPNLSTDTISV